VEILDTFYKINSWDRTLSFCFFGWDQVLNSWLHTCKACALPHLQYILLWLFFGDGDLVIWPRTVILLISASKVARIMSMSHQHLAPFCFLIKLQCLDIGNIWILWLKTSVLCPIYPCCLPLPLFKWLFCPSPCAHFCSVHTLRWHTVPSSFVAYV
jgi:hypothetical protein